MLILRRLKSCIFSRSQVLILRVLKSFVSKEISGIVEVLILRGLGPQREVNRGDTAVYPYLSHYVTFYITSAQECQEITWHGAFGWPR